LLCITMGACPFPDNFITKVVRTKDSIHEDFQIMACDWITM
jgi:hypothetical protein